MYTIKKHINKVLSKFFKSFTQIGRYSIPKVCVIGVINDDSGTSSECSIKQIISAGCVGSKFLNDT